jgi:4-alpha-glucanotransferase
VSSQRELAHAALRALGIERLALAIHDASFPSATGEDVGRGSPYSRGGHAFIDFARELGFEDLQLGPQGQTSFDNPSPYDGSAFSKSILSIALPELTEATFARVLSREMLEAAAEATPRDDTHAHYKHAFDVAARALAIAAINLKARAAAGDSAARELCAQVAAFEARTEWLAHDARFEAFVAEHGTDDVYGWPKGDRAPGPLRVAEVERKQRHVLDAYALGQYILDVQHHALRAHMRRLGMRLHGDLHIGLSGRDQWSREHLFLQRYRMGAPPSRTNPAGQPWGYPVLDPRQYLRRFVGDDDSGPVAFLRARATKLFAELDAVRIDHPHGLVCPWVYDGDAPDPWAAVIAGARLFETPASPAHPALAELAIVGPEQIDPRVAAHDDAHVLGITPAQLIEYERLFEVIMECAREGGRGANELLCEVLSTCPAPLAAVLKQYGLGRFRVTQKARVGDEADGYRGENAERHDWIMIGNHDTPPLRAVIERWGREGTREDRAAYLATRLEPDADSPRRAIVAEALARDPRRLALGMFADLFVGPAANVLVFFADLYGETEAYNVPGVISDANWRLRVPRAFRAVYMDRVARGDAMDVMGALALAMRARGEAFARGHEDLVRALEARAWLRLE